jgi:nitrous oxide reductase accessory protein NosL
MGKEAIPFFRKAAAEQFAAGGGSVLHFKEVTVEKIKG